MRTERLPALRPLRVFGWIGALATAILLLSAAGEGALAAPRLDPATWPGWAAQRDPVASVVALLRLVTLGLAWYLLGATLLHVAAHLRSSTRVIAVADLLTLPSVHRLLQGAFGFGFATAAALGPASAAPTLVPADTGRISLQITSDASEMILLSADDTVMLPVPPPLPQPEEQAQQRVWIVQPGEHFWSIAEQVLSQAWGRPPSDRETAPYWEQLVETNRERLADRFNPDFVRPRDRFLIPPPPAQGQPVRD